MIIPLAHSFDDVLLAPKYFRGRSRGEIDVSTTVAGIELPLPLIAANMSFCNMKFALEFARLGGLPVYPRWNTIEEQSAALGFLSVARTDSGMPLKFGAAIGIDDECIKRADSLIDAGVDIIFIDVAHADQQRTFDVYVEFRKHHPKFPLCVGTFSKIGDLKVNNASKSGSRRNKLLFDMVEDRYCAFRLGVGGGSSCTTRIMTGCGYPTLQAVLDSNNVHYDVGLGTHGPPPGGIVFDGGVRGPAELVKGLAAGGCAAMIGGAFAGTDESAMTSEQGGKKAFAGNASMIGKQMSGLPAEYIEGAHGYVSKTGPLAGVFKKFEDGLRSGMSYCGAMSISEMQKKAEFLLISNNGRMESEAHGFKV